jgi:uncharacterized membrane protein YqjE
VAILQALLALITRSAGKILNAIFGWAVHALFGRTTARDQTLLSALVGAAVVWPLLVVGIAAPKIAALALAFVPIPHAVPSWIIRAVWITLALAVPIALGLTLAARSRALTRESTFEKVLRGFPVTLGLALAFLIMFVSVPVMRLISLARREKTADIPLMTDVHAYHQVAAQIVETLGRHGFGLRATDPSWWVKAPTRLLSWFGGSAFSGFVPEKIEHYVGKDIELSFYTSGVLLRGRGVRSTWAHGLIVESTVHGSGLQTFAPAAQEIERRVKRLWKHFDADRAAHEGSAAMLALVQELAHELARLDVDYDEWQVVYRQLMQLERVIRGEPQLLDDATEGQQPGKKAHVMTTGEQTTEGLSTPALIKEIGRQVTLLAKTELELAKTELRANLTAEVKAAAGLGIAGIAAIVATNLLLVTGVLALAQVMPAWAAGLIVSGVVLVVAAVAAAVGWSKRVRRPLEQTRRELKEDMQWTKERVA